ncbi:sigma 54-interacting transcriptional regulator [Sporosarcina ureae]|uniref:sigma 54-interacting transcriptional regulator n=1 Tax=Sporosarcina ureae TaxID=1571 RepID=UPI000A17AEA5|nr:sigma 54-interacting transcriptional regulator [Sporosarcina ureae]ARK20960.1 hypothetical protein SporoP32a_05055 [Sporosarcina ureae]
MSAFSGSKLRTSGSFCPQYSVNQASSIYTLTNNKEIASSNIFFSNSGKRYSIYQRNIPLLIGKQKIGNILITKDFSKTEDFIETLYVRQTEVAQDDINKEKQHSSFFSDTKALSSILKELKQLENPSANLIFYGDRGTGKNALARFYAENILSKPVYMINCGLLSSQSLSNMLFGSNSKAGYLELAHKGALIIDKLTLMPLFIQERLFNALKTNTIIRNGCDEEIEIDTQIISLLNEKPWEAIQEQRLNENLFYELSSFSFYIPSLQEQQISIMQYAEYFLELFGSNNSNTKHSFALETVTFLKNYHFPGNLRQLKHMIEWMINRSPTESEFKINHLPEYLQTVDAQIESTTTATYNPKIDLVETVEQYERQIIENTLNRCNYHLTNTANQLGISRQNLNYKIKKHQIEFEK